MTNNIQSGGSFSVNYYQERIKGTEKASPIHTLFLKEYNGFLRTNNKPDNNCEYK